jgi:Predicted permease
VSGDQINRAGDSAIGALRGHQEQLTSGALSTAGTLTEILTGALLTLFTLIFFLHGGRNIWQFVTRALPASVRERVRDAGRSGFHSLIGYVRATFLVALVDAAGIGAGLAVMGIPLALPLASVVFLGAFIPLVGAVISGFLAVVVALLAKGIVYALLTLALIIAVQQLEAHVLQPFVMGRAVSLHPLAVVLGIAAGSVIAGIIGALLAVPAIAFLNNAVRVLLAKDPDVNKRCNKRRMAPSSKHSRTQWTSSPTPSTPGPKRWHGDRCAEQVPKPAFASPHRATRRADAQRGDGRSSTATLHRSATQVSLDNSEEIRHAHRQSGCRAQHSSHGLRQGGDPPCR